MMLALMVSVSTFADDVEKDGIRYRVDWEKKEAVVICKDPEPRANEGNYSGDIVIPSVLNDGIAVTGIESEAFCYSGVTSISLPNSLVSIGDDAFRYSCLETIVIPNSVKSIGKGAFSKCNMLTSVTISESVTSIGADAFYGAHRLSSIVVKEGNKVYDSRNNCNAIIETSSNILMSGCKNTKIPNSVTTIGEMAFYDCDGLISVEIPNGVTTIGKEAFAWCESLKSITIPNSVTKIGDEIETFVRSFTSYEDNPFIGCKNLEKIVVDINNKKYDSRDDCNAIIETNRNILVAGCKNTKIPDSVTAIGENAFVGCSNLKNIIIPNSVIEIGYRAFEGCVSLANVSISNSVSSIKWGIFRGCKSLTSVTIPNSVTSIGTWAFEDCKSLLEGREVNVTGNVDVSVLRGEGSVVCLDIIEGDCVDALVGGVVGIDTVTQPQLVGST